MVYLNGDFLEKDKAFVSVMDRGFLFGDSVYEGPSCIRGQYLLF